MPCQSRGSDWFCISRRLLQGPTPLICLNIPTPSCSQIGDSLLAVMSSGLPVKGPRSCVRAIDPGWFRDDFTAKAKGYRGKRSKGQANRPQTIVKYQVAGETGKGITCNIGNLAPHPPLLPRQSSSTPSPPEKEEEKRLQLQAAGT